LDLPAEEIEVRFHLLLGFGLGICGTYAVGAGAQTVPTTLREQAVAPRGTASGQPASGQAKPATAQKTAPSSERRWAGNLTLPVLGGPSGSLRVLSHQNLLAPPPAVEMDPNGQPIPALGDRRLISYDPRTGASEPPVILASQWTSLDMVTVGERGIIAQTILGYTENIEPASQGRTAENPAPTLPVFSLHTGASLAPAGQTTERARLPRLSPPEIRPGAAQEQTVPNTSYRLARSVRDTNVISWRSASNMPQAPATADEGSGFRLPRAIQGMVNVNMHFGMGIPNYSPNIGSITQGYLGLSSIYNYLSPDIADRFQAPYNQQAPRRK
jgi:hypothetical protein